MFLLINDGGVGMTLFGVTFTLSDVVDIIILLGALCAAIYKIWDFFAKNIIEDGLGAVWSTTSCIDYIG